ncbi:MAG: O-antigen ligase domain-containing protein [Tepidisphaeraceae bacterium]|jgi:hypothetical protein
MFGIQGNAFASLALFGYIPFAFLMFAILPARKAVIYDFLVAWLFLPMSHLPLHGFTDFNKMSAACVGTLLGACLFDLDTVLSFRLKIRDIPMLVWCVCPFVSSYFNGHSTYDGISAVVYQTTSWGLPYFIGRVYFNDLKGLRELAIGIVVGGLLYLPFVWFELRMSPQLHRIVYGYMQYEFAQATRYGGYRPMVFMQHGLAVAMWMVTTAMTAFWLWRCKVVDKIMGIPMWLVCLLLVGTAAWDHSVGAAALMAIGLTVLWLTEKTKSSIWIVILTLIPPTWMVIRSTDYWNGRDMVHFIQQFDKRAAQSLAVRLSSERVLVDRALEQPIYGWTSWHLYEGREETQSRGVPDQMWIIAFGKFGLIGLISMTTALLMPVLVLAWRIPVRYWQHPGAAPAAALAMLLTLHMCDMLFNAMINPIFILCAGGVTGLGFSMRGLSRQLPVRPKLMNAPPHPLTTGPSAASA